MCLNNNVDLEKWNLKCFLRFSDSWKLGHSGYFLFIHVIFHTVLSSSLSLPKLSSNSVSTINPNVNECIFIPLSILILPWVRWPAISIIHCALMSLTIHKTESIFVHNTYFKSNIYMKYVGLFKVRAQPLGVSGEA